VLAARYGDPPPLELRLNWLCERYGQLPEPGSVMEQPAELLRRMTALENIYSTVQRVGNLKGEQIHTMTTNERKLYRWLIDNNMLYPEYEDGD
jgi:hypothetical protein